LKQIEIKTSGRISIQFDIANLRDRALAFIVDSIILYAIIFILFFLGIGIIGENIERFMYIIILPIFFFYTLICEIFWNGITPGKRAMGIRVIKLNGEFARTNDYLIRWLFRWLDIWLSVFVIGSILINSSRNAQRLGDILAGTTLIKFNSKYNMELKDILDIDNQQNHTPKFLQVVQLRDEDMIIVKQTLFSQMHYKNNAHNKRLKELADHLREELKIKHESGNDVEFLKTLLKDYIVLTRS
jgi:uncharacterized RDD family membrane protein YckC